MRIHHDDACDEDGDDDYAGNNDLYGHDDMMMMSTIMKIHVKKVSLGM
jgi:hypothetical protein